LNKLLQMILVAGLAMSATQVLADTKVGYVQVEKILQEAPQAKEISAKLQREFASRVEDLERLKKRILDQEAELDKGGKSADAGNKLSQDISSQQIDFQRKQRELNEDVQLRQNEESAGLQNSINKAVTAVAEAEGYDLVVYNSVAYVSKKIDITDKVLKSLAK